MSLKTIILLSLTEIIGDVGLKYFATEGTIKWLSVGLVGYCGVIGLLIYALQNSTILMVNGAWDGVSALLVSLFVIIFLGETFSNYLQYFGLIFIILGIYLLKIPFSDDHPFHIPEF